MGTNAKLALAVIALIGAAAGGFLGLRAATHGGGMDHGPDPAHDADPHEGAVVSAPSPPAPVRGALYVVVPSGDRSLAQEALSEIADLPGIAEVQGFLVVPPERGGPAQGVEAGRRVFGVEAGRPVDIAPALRWGRVFTREEEGEPVAVAGRRWAETHESTYGFILTGMGHPTPVEVRGTVVTVVGEFETGAALDEALIMPLRLAGRIYGLEGSLTGALVRARLDLASLREAVAALDVPVTVRAA